MAIFHANYRWFLAIYAASSAKRWPHTFSSITRRPSPRSVSRRRIRFSTIGSAAGAGRAQRSSKKACGRPPPRRGTVHQDRVLEFPADQQCGTRSRKHHRRRNRGHRRPHQAHLGGECLVLLRHPQRGKVQVRHLPSRPPYPSQLLHDLDGEKKTRRQRDRATRECGDENKKVPEQESTPVR